MAVAAFVDSFDGYPLSQINRKWTQTPNVSLSAGQGRRLTTALNCASHAAAGAFLSIPESPTITMGFAIKPTNFAYGAGNNTAGALCTFWGQNYAHIGVETRSDGHIYVSRKYKSLGTRWGGGQSYTFSNGVVVSTDTGLRSGQPLALGSWQYIEVSITRQPTPTAQGSIEVRVNGSTASGIPQSPIYTDAISGSNSPFAMVGIGSCSALDNYSNASSYSYYDDVYITYGDSQYWSCGDSRVDYLALNSDSLPMDWVPSDGRSENRYILLRDSSGAMSATTSGQAMAFGVTDLNFTPQVIHGVQVASVGHKSDAGMKIIKLQIRSGTSTFETQALPLGTGDTGLLGTALTAPDGGPWTVGKVNAMLVGAVVDT